MVAASVALVAGASTFASAALVAAVSAAASAAPPLCLPPGGRLAVVPGGRGSSGGDDGIRVSAERPPGRSVSFNSFGSLARRCRERTAIIAAVIAASPFVSGNGKERAVEHGPRARPQLSPTGGFMLPPPDRPVSFSSFGSLVRRCRERTAIIAAVMAASLFVSGNGKESC